MGGFRVSTGGISIAGKTSKAVKLIRTDIKEY